MKFSNSFLSEIPNFLAVTLHEVMKGKPRKDWSELIKKPLLYT